MNGGCEDYIVYITASNNNNLMGKQLESMENRSVKPWLAMGLGSKEGMSALTWERRNELLAKCPPFAEPHSGVLGSQKPQLPVVPHFLGPKCHVH